MGKVIDLNKPKPEECKDCPECYQDMYEMAKDFIYELIKDDDICQEQKWMYLACLQQILSDILPEPEGDLN